MTNKEEKLMLVADKTPLPDQNTMSKGNQVEQTMAQILVRIAEELGEMNEHLANIREEVVILGDSNPSID